LALTFGHLIGSNYFGKGKQMISHGILDYTICDIVQRHMKSTMLKMGYRHKNTMWI